MLFINSKYNLKKQMTLYHASIYTEGVCMAKRTFTKKKDAVLWYTKNKSKFRYANSTSDMRFEECLTQFLSRVKTRITKYSFQRYEKHSEYFYKSPLAKLKISELRGVQIIKWIDWLKSKPADKKRISFIAELKSLIAILNWYKNFLNEDFNIPVTKKHREYCFLKSKAPRRPDYFIRPQDARRWVEWLKENKRNPVYYRIATFMLLTGVRVSEACGLKWDSVDLEEGSVWIIRRVGWDRITKIPELDDITKTSQSARCLRLPKRLQKMLGEMKKESQSEIIFTGKQGELLKYNAIQSAFNSGFKSLNLPWRSTHICRHTFATIALMETKDLSAVQASLGHAEQRITQKYAKTIALLNSEVGERTSYAIFQNDF